MKFSARPARIFVYEYYINNKTHKHQVWRTQYYIEY